MLYCLYCCKPACHIISCYYLLVMERISRETGCAGSVGSSGLQRTLFSLIMTTPATVEPALPSLDAFLVRRIESDELAMVCCFQPCRRGWNFM
jgi:hypothetical protein